MSAIQQIAMALAVAGIGAGQGLAQEGQGPHAGQQPGWKSRLRLPCCC